MVWEYEGIEAYVSRRSGAGLREVYRSWNGRDHFYTVSSNEWDRAVHGGYGQEGIAFYVLESQQSGTLPLYRLWYDIWGDHFYTTSSAERDNAINQIGFKDEGTLGYVYPPNIPPNIEGYDPLYRGWNPPIGDHFYTIDCREMSFAVGPRWLIGDRTWGYERLVGFAGASQQESQLEGYVPIYRAWNGGDHFYTHSRDEWNRAESQHGYTKEGIGFYLSAEPKPDHLPLYRLYNGTWRPGGDHFYTTSEAEKDNAVNQLRFQDEGIVGYILRAQGDGPPITHRRLHRAFHPRIADHFYTTNCEEIIKVRASTAEGLGHPRGGPPRPPEPKPPRETRPVARGQGTNAYFINYSGDTRYMYKQNPQTLVMEHVATLFDRQYYAVHVPCGMATWVYAKDQISDVFNDVTYSAQVPGACLPYVFENVYEMSG